jgi:hypothetical protein
MAVEKSKGERQFIARDTLIRKAKDCAERMPELREEFEALALQIEEAPLSYDELAATVRATRPELAHTLEWDEHPDDWNDECFCYECMTQGD